MKLSTKGPLINTDAKTKRDALQFGADISDATVRQIRASALGESIYSYEQRLKDIGVEF
jgi:hypothetical protein